jgi:hypothetical protein
MDNRDLLPPKSKFKLMHRDNLYDLLGTMGVKWDTHEQQWYSENGNQRTTVIQEPSSIFTVRINARIIDMGNRVAEFLELCEAINWYVLKQSNLYQNDDNQSGRVYITLKLND